MGSHYLHDSGSGSEQWSTSLGHGVGVLCQGRDSGKRDGGDHLGGESSIHWTSLHKNPVGSRSYHFCRKKKIEKDEE